MPDLPRRPELTDVLLALLLERGDLSVDQLADYRGFARDATSRSNDYFLVLDVVNDAARVLRDTVKVSLSKQRQSA